MRPYFLFMILPILFQACNALPGKLDLSTLALLISRAGTAEISGIAMKGRIMGAKVQVIPLVKNACDRTGATSAYAETTTDENGNYAVRYPKNGNPVCVLITPSENGRTLMYDEALRTDIPWTEKNFYLDTIVQEPSGPTQKGVVSSPFSRMAARVFAKTMEKADPSFTAAVANASSRQVVSMFGLNKGFVRSEPKNRSLKNKSPDAHPRSFGKRAIPASRISKSRNSNSSSRVSREASRSVTPTLEDLGLDFNKPDDPFVATSLIKLSGISALANGFAKGATKSIKKGLTTRSTANGDALELVIDGFSQVIESGGRRNTILAQVFQQSTGRAPPANFTRNPLEATMQSGIASFVQNSGGAEQFGINVDDIDDLFSMSSTPPTDLMVDTSSAPDYLYYADNNDEGALLLFTNNFENYYPWVEGGLPTRYEVSRGTLPAGMSLNPVTGELSGTPTTASASTQISIRASNLFGSTSTTFRVRVQNFVPGQAFAFVYYSTCTQNTTCDLDIGIEGIRNSNYTITGFTSTAGTFRVTDGFLGSISGTAGNVSGARKGTLSYTDLNTGTPGTITDIDFYIDPDVPRASIWFYELVQGFQFSYVAFEVNGVGDFGTYSFVPQDFGNGMSMDRFGSITGNPTTSGTWSPTITVISATGQRYSVSLGNLTIGVAGSDPQLGFLDEFFGGGGSPNNGTITLFYTGSCIEGEPNCVLTIDTVTSILPVGLTFANLSFTDDNGELTLFDLSIDLDGTITGIPSTSGSFLVDIFGTDSNFNVYDFRVVLFISPPLGSTITYSNSPFTFNLGEPIPADIGIPVISPNQTFTTCTSNPQLPEGLFLDNATCEIKGTPNGSSQPPTNYTIFGSNSNGIGTAVVSISLFSGA